MYSSFRWQGNARHIMPEFADGTVLLSFEWCTLGHFVGVCFVRNSNPSEISPGPKYPEEGMWFDRNK